MMHVLFSAVAPGTISYSPEDYTTPLLKCIQGNGGVIDSFNYRFYRHHAPMPPQAYVNGRELYVPGFNEDDVGIYSCEAFNDKGISYGHPYEWYTDSTYECKYFTISCQCSIFHLSKHVIFSG